MNRPFEPLLLSGRGWLVAVVVLIASFATTPAHAQSSQGATLDQLAREAQSYPERISQLEERYLNPAVLESRFRLETRFNDARVAYLLGDYVRASVMFVAVVDNPKVRQFDSYRDALYLLGDSLYQLRSYRAARSYFRVIVDMGPGKNYQESVIRLLEIASVIDDYDGVDALYARLDSMQTINSALAYMRGKTLYRQKKYGEARQWFQRASADGEHAFAARYYEGITFAAQRQLAPAREAFQSIVGQAPRTPRDSNIVDLAQLALGRLAYEEGDFDTAIDHYLRLPRTSPSFERALYELTWALISKKNYGAALRNVDILMLSNPSAQFIPESRLLMADLALKVGEYDEARRSYQDVLNTFVPVRDELAQFLAGRTDLENFFVELVRLEAEGARPHYMPPMVAEWTGANKLLESARRLVQDNMMTQEDIDEGFAAIEEIEALLATGSRIQAFPALSEGVTSGIAAEAGLIELSRNLLAVERRLLDGVMTPEEKQRWNEYERQLLEYQQQYEAVPRSEEALRERRARIDERFVRLRRELDATGYEIDTLRVQLGAVDTYLQNNPLDSMPAQDRRRVDEIRTELRRTIADMEKVKIALQRELDIARRDVGVGDEVSRRERELRAQFQRHIDEREQFLAGIHTRVGGTPRAQLARIAQIRSTLPASRQRLERYFTSMNELVEERVTDIRKTLDVEYDVLLAYQQELNLIRENSEATAAQIAHLNFIEVGTQFEEIILRGHVGLIDVSWQRKEDMTNQINQLFEDRSAELQLLRDAFKDVR